MSRPRMRIATLMFAVVIAALIFGAFEAGRRWEKAASPGAARVTYFTRAGRLYRRVSFPTARADTAGAPTTQ